jgi:hypothetical protein
MSEYAGIPESGSAPPLRGLDRLIADGKVSRPVSKELPETIEVTGDVQVLSRALEEVRGDR